MVIICYGLTWILKLIIVSANKKIMVSQLRVKKHYKSSFYRHALRRKKIY